MRHLTLNFIQAQLGKPLEPKRRPRPFPGQHFPTRVAWHIVIAYPPYPVKSVKNPKPGGQPEYIKQVCPARTRTLQYIGKPNAYRVREALSFMRTPSTIIKSLWVAEFDRAGLVAYQVRPEWGSITNSVGSATFAAYHPQAATPDILGAFARAWHIKRIGVGRKGGSIYLYSPQKKLSLDQIEAYYGWYHNTFARKLRRPKAPAMVIENGQVVKEEVVDAPKPENAQQ